MSLSNYLSISLAILTLIISVFILIPNEPINLSNLLANSLADTASMDFEEKELSTHYPGTSRVKKRSDFSETMAIGETRGISCLLIGVPRPRSLSRLRSKRLKASCAVWDRSNYRCGAMSVTSRTRFPPKSFLSPRKHRAVTAIVLLRTPRHLSDHVLSAVL